MFKRGEGEHQQGRPIDAGEVRMAEGGGEVTVVGKGARVEGSLVSAGSLRIDGQVKGKISADGDVAISGNSQVEADIHARNVTVGGTFKGNIVSKGKTELARGGRVDGNITSRTLIVAEGASFTGQSVMDRKADETAGPEAASREPARAPASQQQGSGRGDQGRPRQASGSQGQGQGQPPGQGPRPTGPGPSASPAPTGR